MCMFNFSLVDLDPKRTMKECFHKFGLDQNTTDFVGHALALYRDDEYECMHMYSVCT